jgi:hypothetical protein
VTTRTRHYRTLRVHRSTYRAVPLDAVQHLGSEVPEPSRSQINTRGRWPRRGRARAVLGAAGLVSCATVTTSVPDTIADSQRTLILAIAVVSVTIAVRLLSSPSHEI